MNRAIFDFTLQDKFSNWKLQLPLLGFVIMPAYMLYLAVQSTPERIAAGTTIWHYFENPAVYLFYSYIFVSDGFVSSRPTGDSTAMTLLFTRPITRFDYVMTKFVAASLGVTALLLPAALLAHGVSFLIGLPPVFDVSLAASIILNSMLASAFVVFLHCLPGVLGVFTFLMLAGCSSAGDMFLASASSDIPEILKYFAQIMRNINFWIGDFFFPFLNVGQLSSGVSFDYTAIVVYLSNITSYLFLGTYVLAHREFFYASE